MLISEKYRQLQQELHKNRGYGQASVDLAPYVAEVIRRDRVEELLDYGAGKGRLGEELEWLVPWPLRIHRYDPAVPEWSARPEPAPFVACIDVLEHIEPDLLPNVLDDLARVTAGTGLFTVATGPAMKILPDGRNAHLIQQPASWWLPLFMKRFELRQFVQAQYGFRIEVGGLQR
jgi:2-polyprenyl-3-methyl-5-hydroxy-6-metoxy-1,4-benzoquinol methylase